jgi:hypothetical protein
MINVHCIAQVQRELNTQKPQVRNPKRAVAARKTLRAKPTAQMWPPHVTHQRLQCKICYE